MVVIPKHCLKEQRSELADFKVENTMTKNAARSAARTGAVQALYQMEIAGTDVSEVIEEFRSVRFPSADNADLIANADTEFFAEILNGVLDHQRQLDQLIDDHLAKGWRLSRLDSTLRAILRAGSYELIARNDIPARVIINEYVEIAHAFFTTDEPRVVNGVLDKIAHAQRANEFVGATQRSQVNANSPTGQSSPDDDFQA